MGHVIMKALKFLTDILLISGCGLILVGVYQVWPMATWFVGGAMLIIFGIAIGIGNRGTK